MVAFSAVTRLAVVAFWQFPNHWLVAFGQVTFKLFKFNGAGPTLKRTISFSPSGLLQASTKILSISKHFGGIWAITATENNRTAKEENSFFIIGRKCKTNWRQFVLTESYSIYGVLN
jgi:hypothetical protein